MQTAARSLAAVFFILAATSCANREPAPQAAPPTLTAASCPCMTAAGDGGVTCAGMMAGGHGMMMGPGHEHEGMMHGGPMPHGGPGMGGGPGGGPMMGPGPMMGGGPPTPPPALTPEAKAALLRALDDEYRAEALYVHLAAKLGARPLAMIAHAEHRHAWVLESLALAHGLELPANAWSSTKQPDVANAAAACRAGADSEKKTIATYDELLKGDLPPDLKRAFTNLRAASAERHLPAFEACR